MNGIESVESCARVYAPQKKKLYSLNIWDDIVPISEIGFSQIGAMIQENQTMNTAVTVTQNTETANQRRILADALYCAHREHYTTIDKTCHIDPIRPESPKQLVEWIKADKFKYDEEIDPAEPMDYLNDIIHAISFKDQDPDYIKAKTLKEKMQDDFETLKLRNQIIDPEKMLKEVEDFKKKTYH